MHAHPVASFEVPGSRVVPTQGAKHNKYCHFCQHVKVRASGMLACCNKDCTRRFCEHCLSKSIGDDVNPQTSPAWIGGQWHCPVCRKLCCCALGECDKNHRHCKAYRYRVRRAEQQAFKRTGVTGGEDGEEGEGEEAAARPNAEKTSASVEKNSAKVDKDVRMTPVAAPVAPKLENASDVLQSIPVVSAPPAKGASNGATPQPSAAMMLEAPPQLLAHQQQQVKKEPSFTGSNASAKSLSPPRRYTLNPKS
ncbi:hypothetical protein T484DRAFT_2624849 [Baffinella frigidus]|nr:hypothetical protein T484DRAFT_2624849 [Cryptophyta sp. CCMP2293]